MTSLTGEEFVRALSSQEGLPALSSASTIDGMVKPSTADVSKAVLFSPGTSCNVWIPVPASVIEKVDLLGKIPCRDHEHDYVRLPLKKPSNPETAVFADLLQAQGSSIAAFELSKFPDETEAEMGLVHRWDGNHLGPGAAVPSVNWKSIRSSPQVRR
jgi:hypothetical protein